MRERVADKAYVRKAGAGRSPKPARQALKVPAEASDLVWVFGRETKGKVDPLCCARRPGLQSGSFRTGHTRAFQVSVAAFVAQP